MTVRDDVINVILSPVNGAVEFHGSGTVHVGLPNTPLSLVGVIIPGSESNIRTVRLTVESSIVINGNSILQAAEGDSINLVDRKVVIVLSSNGKKTLPTLDLGLIGFNYSTLPQAVHIKVPVGLTAEELANFQHSVISGRSLSNCEEWLELIQMDRSGFTAKCTDTAQAGLLDNETQLSMRSVVIVPLSSPSPEEQDSSKVGLIVVVAVAAGIVVFLLYRKQKGNVDDSGQGDLRTH
jgi:hypothetical protein